MTDQKANRTISQELLSHLINTSIPMRKRMGEEMGRNKLALHTLTPANPAWNDLVSEQQHLYHQFSNDHIGFDDVDRIFRKEVGRLDNLLCSGRSDYLDRERKALTS